MVAFERDIEAEDALGNGQLERDSISLDLSGADRSLLIGGRSRRARDAIAALLQDQMDGVLFHLAVQADAGLAGPRAGHIGGGGQGSGQQESSEQSPHPSILTQFDRSAITGSIRDARQAGMYPAMAATASSSAPVPTNGTRS